MSATLVGVSTIVSVSALEVLVAALVSPEYTALIALLPTGRLVNIRLA